jgi:hypothetical protein
MHQRRYGQEFRKRLWLMRILLAVAMVISCLLAGISQGIINWSALITTGIMLAVLIGLLEVLVHPRFRPLFARIDRGSVRREIARNPGLQRLLRNHLVAIDSMGFRQISGDSTGLTSWTDIEEVILSNEHVFVVFGDSSGFPVPRRAFPDDTSFQSFYETARAYLNQAKHRPIGC